MTSAVPLPRSWRFGPKRSLQLEAMDLPDLDPLLREQSLRGLRRLRRFFLRTEPLHSAIEAILPPGDGRTLRLVELGAGTAEVCSALGRALERTGRRVEMVATDRVAAPGVQAFDCTASTGWMEADLFFSHLVLHHLGADEIRRSLDFQARCSRFGSVHLDLVRSRISFYLARLFMPLLRYPRINQSDALLSIQAAFSTSEMFDLAQGIPGNREVRKIFPFRQILVSSSKGEPSPVR